MLGREEPRAWVSEKSSQGSVSIAAMLDLVLIKLETP